MNNTTDNKPTPIVVKCEPTEYCCCIRTDNNNNTYTHSRALATNHITIDKLSITSNILRLSK